MKKIFIILGIVWAFVFLEFVMTVFFGMDKKYKKPYYAGVALCLFLLAYWTGTGFDYFKNTFDKTYNMGHSIVKAILPRTGEDVYEVFFGKPESECLKVKHLKDQSIPFVDYAIFFHFTTCPEEVKRIIELKEYQFEFSKSKTSHWDNYGPPKWFNTAILGDSMLVYDNSDEVGNGTTLFINIEQTEGFCIDVLD